MMRLRFTFALLLLVLTACQPASEAFPVCDSSNRNCTSFDAASFRAIDGDTFQVGDHRFRLADWDSPETGNAAGCAKEVELGVRAEVEAMLLVSATETVTIEALERDQFGRTYAHIWLDGAHIGELLQEKGLSQPWPGGDSPKPDWCQ